MKLFIFILITLNFFSCRGQSDQQNNQSNKTVGGPFENGEFTYWYARILTRLTLCRMESNGQKLLITGTMFKTD
jgi:hypothetical protein